uniref:Uncharacterized protein n=1 Tax=Myoviridae sp. ctCo31 TaxID=2825053 RepID=A0A8S5UMY6_9CAUD|nr:MAG TPA: hypothetical protein [Myoviridae sp. ctCo31]
MPQFFPIIAFVNLPLFGKYGVESQYPNPC